MYARFIAVKTIHPLKGLKYIKYKKV